MSEQELDRDVDELMGGLEKAERKRRARALAIGVVIAGMIVALGVFAVVFSDDFFRPELDVEGGEEDVLAKTNDPECRGFIGRVTAIEADYRAIEPQVEVLLKTDDVETVRSVKTTIANLRERLERQEEASAEANLRFEDSRSELDRWFDYIDGELSLLEDLAAWRLDKLGAVEEAAAGSADAGAAEAGAGNADAGDEVVHVEEKEKGRPTGAARVEASSKTPKELHEGSMLATHEAFQSFRVWHTGSLHPCGAAEDGETPWSPDSAADTTE